MRAAGIVTYNPELDLLKENLDALVKQCEHVVIVDNHSVNIDQLEQLFRQYPQIILIKNEANLGVATALNQIAKQAEQDGFRWVLLLDQDSVIDENLFVVYEQYIDLDRVAILTPLIVDRTELIAEQPAAPEQPEFGDPFEYIRKGITSGSYINIPICAQLGYFDEAMFIDYVDFEYCYRVRQAGFKILQCNETRILHRLGAIEWVNVLGRRFEVTNHSAGRCYYVARNAEYCLLKHNRFLSRRNEYKKLIKKGLKIILFEQDKSSKISAMHRGIIDGRKLYRQETAANQS
jgi:rhamnosyltransferase